MLLDRDSLYIGDIFAQVRLTCDAQEPDLSFGDVAEDAWYAQAVRFVAANGLFQGTSEGKFSPDMPMSRAMIWTVLAGYDGVDTTGGDPWYAPGQSWAMENSVSDGSDPNGSITREQLIATSRSKGSSVRLQEIPNNKYALKLKKG